MEWAGLRRLHRSPLTMPSSPGLSSLLKPEIRALKLGFHPPVIKEPSCLWRFSEDKTEKNNRLINNIVLCMRDCQVRGWDVCSNGPNSLIVFQLPFGYEDRRLGNVTLLFDS